MTYTVASSSFHLGYSVTWSLVYSPVHLKFSIRFNIVLSAYLRGFLRFFKMKLVRWFLFGEARYIKLGLLTMYGSVSRFTKSKRRRRLQRYFAFWNYTYVNKASQTARRLMNISSEKPKPKKKVYLFSGILVTKMFKRIFFRLGFNRSTAYHKSIKKLSRHLNAAMTPDRSYNLIKYRSNRFRIKELAHTPSMQFFNHIHFKLTRSLIDFVNKAAFSKLGFVAAFLNIIIKINLFIESETSIKKNSRVFNLLSNFSSAAKAKKKKKGRGKVYPKTKLFFDFLTHITGISEKDWVNSSKVVNSRNMPIYKRNTPWSSLFIHGFYMPLSLKRVFRRYLIASKSVSKRNFFFSEIKYLRFPIVNAIIKKNMFYHLKFLKNESGSITTDTFSFNRKFVKRIKKMLLLFSKRAFFKNKLVSFWQKKKKQQL